MHTNVAQLAFTLANLLVTLLCFSDSLVLVYEGEPQEFVNRSHAYKMLLSYLSDSWQCKKANLAFSLQNRASAD